MDESQKELEILFRRLSLENRELHANIQIVKNRVPKNDKNRRKQLRLNVTRLEAKMRQRNQQEPERFEDHLDPSLESAIANLMKLSLEDTPPQLTKVVKRRKRRAARERQHRRRMTKAKTKQLSTQRLEEEQKISAILRSKNLEMKTVPADGHCMYHAIRDQMEFSATVHELRDHTAHYMRQHIDDFLPFFTEPEAGNLYTREDFLRYCDDIAGKALWGGQLELRALSHVLETPIEVVQANTPIITIGQEYKRRPLVLVYLHYAYKFGEHYNSVKPIETAGAVRGMAPRYSRCFQPPQSPEAVGASNNEPRH